MAEELKTGSGPATTTAKEDFGPLDEGQLAQFLLGADKQTPPVEEASDAENETSDVTSEDSPSDSNDGDAGDETPAEADVESAGEEEASEDEVEKGPEWFQKRVKSYTARAKSAEERAESAESKLKDLEAKLAEVEERAQSPKEQPVNGPLSAVRTEEELEQKIREYRKIKRFCEANPDGTVVKLDNGQEVEYSKEQVREMRFRAEDLLEEEVPKRRDFLKTEVQSRAAALQQFPWWKDRSSPEYQLANGVIQKHTWLKNVPGWMNAIGLMVEGHKAIDARSKAAKAAPVVPKATKQPAKPASSPKAASAKDSKREAARARMLDTGDPEDVAAFLRES